MAGFLQPRYMAPTAASRAQLSTPDPRAATPPISTSTSTNKRTAWMISAAKRVGIIPGTPRSKNEGKTYRRISPRRRRATKARDVFPDQNPNNTLSPFSNAREVNVRDDDLQHKHKGFGPSPALSAKGDSAYKPPERSTPPDKPLPSLPIATVETHSPTVRQFSIDAGDKPLRRSVSPPQGANFEAEWPAFISSRPTTPTTAQEKTHDVPRKKTSSSTAKRLASTTGTAEYDHERAGGSQHTPSTTTSTDPVPQDSGQPVAVLGQQSSANVQGRTPLTNRGAEPSHIQRPGEFSPDAGESPLSATLGETFSIPDTHTENGLMSKPGSETILFPSYTGLFQPNPVHARSSQAGTGVRASRLPKRSSIPDPFRNCSSSQRPAGGRSSPYSSILTSASQHQHSRHDHHFTVAGGAAHQARPQETDDSIQHTNFKCDDMPFLVAVKQLSKNKQYKRQRSSIPRPRHNVYLREDTLSESEDAILAPKRADQKFDDDVADVCEDHRGEREGNALQASRSAANNHEIGTNLDRERANPQCDYASGFQSAENTLMPHATDSGPGFENHLLAASSNFQDKLNTVSESASMSDPYFNTARQRQMIDKPFSRVKRLSATAPEHGPVLRISDSANRMIMGSGSEESPDDARARKRNSLPDLGRSITVKELRKSTEGLLNSCSPLSRSLTTRSLYTDGVKEEAGNTRIASEPHGFCSALPSTASTSRLSRSADLYSSHSNKEVDNSNGATSQEIAKGPINWPLKTPAQVSPESGLAEAHSSEEETSARLPSQACRSTIVPKQKSAATIQSREGAQSGTVNDFNLADKTSQCRVEPSPTPSALDSLAVGKRPIPLSTNGFNDFRPSARKITHFPPRTSSRSSTPDVSAQIWAQLNSVSSQQIPNRFESVRPNRPSQEFASPESITVEPKSLRKSAYKLQDVETPHTSNAAARETSRTQLSSAKSMLSNLKGFFHKRAIDNPTGATRVQIRSFTPREGSTMVAAQGSPFPNHRLQTLPVTNGTTRRAHRRASMTPMPTGSSPQATSPTEGFWAYQNSDDFHRANNLAVRVLDAARKEGNPSEKAKLLQLGQLMVEAVSGARDAEKAMEQAKQAATVAEAHCMRSKKSMLALTRLVGKELDEHYGSGPNTTLSKGI